MSEPKELPKGWEYDAATDCVICTCGFRFGAEHHTGDGSETYECPSCALEYVRSRGEDE